MSEQAAPVPSRAVEVDAGDRFREECGICAIFGECN